jgi:hypothetical protein
MRSPQLASLLFERLRYAAGRQEVSRSHRAEYTVLNACPRIGVQAREVPERDGEDLPKDGARNVFDPGEGTVTEVIDLAVDGEFTSGL